MILPDVNVLIYAFRQDMPQHALCRGWLEKVLASGSRYGMSRLALGALVRITTNPRLFRMASSLEEAFRFSDYLLERSACEPVAPGERHWEIFQRVCRETDTHGPRVTDAWFAALAIEWGCEWITLDRDFARFPGLKWGMPTG